MAYGPDVVSTAGGDAPTGFMRSGDVAPYESTLEAAASKNLPMLCANPDLISMHYDGVAQPPPPSPPSPIHSLT